MHPISQASALHAAGRYQKGTMSDLDLPRGVPDFPTVTGRQQRRATLPQTPPLGSLFDCRLLEQPTWHLAPENMTMKTRAMRASTSKVTLEAADTSGDEDRAEETMDAGDKVGSRILTIEVRYVVSGISCKSFKALRFASKIHFLSHLNAECSVYIMM